MRPIKIYNNPDKGSWGELLRRATVSYSDIEPTVSRIFDDIERNGDSAVLKYTQLFDGCMLEKLAVSSAEIEAAHKIVSSELKDAIKLAAENIKLFHEGQKRQPEPIETRPGVCCWSEDRPIERVGLYIPGGTAPLFSTVLMLAIPAAIAGCKQIVLCTPPAKNGSVAPEILYAANYCGVDSIYKVGGIQAIAGMTFGNGSIPKVDKVFGPGNQYVTVAKQYAIRYGLAIDMPAGPSELLVLCDNTSDPDYVASDLLSQAEHGTDSQVVCLSWDSEILKKTISAIETQLESLGRSAIAEKAIENSRFIKMESEDDAMELLNVYGPEHLIICTDNAEKLLGKISNAGSVFVGNYSPESAGDYASGTNHTLPTNGYARAYSGVNLSAFTKSITFQKITEEGLKNIGPAVQIMARAEGLDAHERAVSIRLNKLAAL